MKKLLVLLLALASMSSFAQTIKLYQTMFTYARITETFELNKDLGRAWINLEVDTSMDPDITPDDVRVKIEGLTYNTETKEVIYTSEGKLTVCAFEKTTRWSIFKNTRLVMTEDCEFKQRIITKMVDDGFEIKKRQYLIVELVIK